MGSAAGADFAATQRCLETTPVQAANWLMINRFQASGGVIFTLLLVADVDLVIAQSLLADEAFQHRNDPAIVDLFPGNMVEFMEAQVSRFGRLALRTQGAEINHETLVIMVE